MTPEEKIKICAMCRNRKMSMKKGIVCGLTGEKPQFEEICETFIVDERVLLEEQRRAEYEQFDETPELIIESSSSSSSDDDAKSKKRLVSIISFVVSFLIFFILGYNNSKDKGQDTRMTEREKLEHSIAQMDKRLPQRIEGGLWTGISVEGKNIIYDLNYDTDIDLSGEDDRIWKMVEKHYRLNYINSVENFDMVELYEYVKGKRYTFVYRCHDASSKYLYTYEINEDELKRAVSSAKYKCPLADIRTVVEYINKNLPFEDEDGVVFGKIAFNEDPYELVYNITLPFTQAEMKSISKKDMDDYAIEYCRETPDAATALVGINEYPIVYVYRSANAAECHRSVITAEMYGK